MGRDDGSKLDCMSDATMAANSGAADVGGSPLEACPCDKEPIAGRSELVIEIKNLLSDSLHQQYAWP